MSLIFYQSLNGAISVLEGLGRKETLPEAQRTHGIDSLTWVTPPVKKQPTTTIFKKHWFQIWPIVCGSTCISSDGATCISCKIGHHLHYLVANLATRWHHLHWFQIWPPDGATCISCKFGHQMAPLALLPKMATRLRCLHCNVPQIEILSC